MPHHPKLMSSKITVLVLVDLLDLTDVVKGVTEARLELRLGSSIDDVHATEFHQQGYTHMLKTGQQQGQGRRIGSYAKMTMIASMACQ